MPNKKDSDGKICATPLPNPSDLLRSVKAYFQLMCGLSLSRIGEVKILYLHQEWKLVHNPCNKANWPACIATKKSNLCSFLAIPISNDFIVGKWSLNHGTVSGQEPTRSSARCQPSQLCSKCGCQSPDSTREKGRNFTYLKPSILCIVPSQDDIFCMSVTIYSMVYLNY